MIESSTVRALQPAADLQIHPLERVRARWDALVASHPGATLYHRGPWLEVLRRAFDVRPLVALTSDSDGAMAGCLLSAGGNPLRRRLVSLPFSDFCPPLAP